MKIVKVTLGVTPKYKPGDLLLDHHKQNLAGTGLVIAVNVEGCSYEILWLSDNAVTHEKINLVDLYMNKVQK